MGDTYPRIKGAVVQAAPVFLDREATVEKACRFIEQAADMGAQVIAFPECYISGYPHWYIYYGAEHPIIMRLYKEMFKNAVVVPSPATDRIGEAARKARAYVVMGINEKDANTYGTMYNSAVFFGPEGEIMGKRRKLVPTVFERLVHAGGDGSTFEVFDTVFGGLSTLLCGENVNTLARFAMLAKGEVIHTALWPAFPMVNQRGTSEGMRIRIKAHAYEGKIFVLSCSGVFTEEMKDAMELNEDARKLFASDGAYSTIINPKGQEIVKPVHGETVLVAEMDFEEIIEGKYMHDVTGHYNRFDVFQLKVNRSPRCMLTETGYIPPLPDFADLEECETEEEEG